MGSGSGDGVDGEICGAHHSDRHIPQPGDLGARPSALAIGVLRKARRGVREFLPAAVSRAHLSILMLIMGMEAWGRVFRSSRKVAHAHILYADHDAPSISRLMIEFAWG